MPRITLPSISERGNIEAAERPQLFLYKEQVEKANEVLSPYIAGIKDTLTAFQLAAVALANNSSAVENKKDRGLASLEYSFTSFEGVFMIVDSDFLDYEERTYHATDHSDLLSHRGQLKHGDIIYFDTFTLRPNGESETGRTVEMCIPDFATDFTRTGIPPIRKTRGNYRRYNLLKCDPESEIVGLMDPYSPQLDVSKQVIFSYQSTETTQQLN